MQSLREEKLSQALHIETFSSRRRKNSPRHESQDRPRLEPASVLMLILREEEKSLDGFEPMLRFVHDLVDVEASPCSMNLAEVL